MEEQHPNRFGFHTDLRRMFIRLHAETKPQENARTDDIVDGEGRADGSVSSSGSFRSLLVNV